jgi:hypothetical protein
MHAPSIKLFSPRVPSALARIFAPKENPIA